MRYHSKARGAKIKRKKGELLKKIQALQERLGYQFKDKNLIIEALTHKSYSKQYNNERLEFLGDAVLDLVVGEYLYKKYPSTAEGNLSKLRASIVNEKGFEKLAIELKLGQAMYLSQSEQNNGGRTKPSLLSNAFEAVIGAFYLEAGLQSVKIFMENLLNKTYKNVDLQDLSKDYKTLLQELSQPQFGVLPQYELVRCFGPDHKKEFEIQVSVAAKYFAKAKGMSKRQAEQKAAMKVLKIINKELK